VFLAAKAQGITFAQENVAYCRSKRPEFIEKMRQQLGDDVAFVLDLKQARRGGTDYKAMADAMGDKIVHFHANDYDDEHDCLLPTFGKCDFNEVAQYLKQNGYNGNAIIEVYRQNYGEHRKLIESMNNLQKII
jgi:sugar phosphate isomerase/epimerase